MNKGLLLYVGALTLFTIYTIHKYEKSIKDYKASIGDYQRALNLVKNRTDPAAHYTWLQLQNSQQKDLIKELDLENSMLQNQVKSLREELAGVQRIQYESSAYENNQWRSITRDTEKIIEI